MVSPKPSDTVYFPAERNIDKQLDLCRLGARKDKVTVVIERVTERRDGTPRRVPLFEISPHGDITEALAPRLRLSITEHLLYANAAHYYALDRNGMNKNARTGHEAIANLVRMTADYIEAARENAREQAQKRGARRSRSITNRKNTAGRRARPFVTSKDVA